MSYFNAFPVVYTADLPKALAFYRDLLGFRQTFQFPPEGEPEFVALELTGGGSLALAAVSNGQIGAHRRPISARTDGFELCIYTEDVDEAVAKIREYLLVEPQDMPWNERMAYVADPDGHPIMICARL